MLSKEGSVEDNLGEYAKLTSVIRSANRLEESSVQRFKKTNNVWDPNFGLKMSISIIPYTIHVFTLFNCINNF